MYEESASLDMEQAESPVSSQTAEDNAAASGQAPEGVQSSDSAEQSGQTGRQSSEENHRYQAARRAGERTGEQSGYAKEVNDRISRLGMSNGSARIQNIEDLESYGQSARRSRIEARAAKEGRSVAEVEEDEDAKDLLAETRRRDAAEAKARKAEAEQKEWLRQDARAFQAAFPAVDLAKLDGDRAFRRFCGSRYGREPLAELYEDYLEINGDAAKAAQARASSKEARSTATGGGSGSETLTAAQQRELDEWNRTYPQLKMTAKEYLAR